MVRQESVYLRYFERFDTVCDNICLYIDSIWCHLKLYLRGRGLGTVIEIKVHFTLRERNVFQKLCSIDRPCLRRDLVVLPVWGVLATWPDS
jgi:hypothetical protein